MVRLNKEDIINEFYNFLKRYDCYDNFLNNIDCEIYNIIYKNIYDCIHFI